MVDLIRWFDRKFETTFPIGTFPVIVERLRGAPVRVEEKARCLSSEMLTRRIDDTWSIQENIGHLLDVEVLWTGRLDDLLDGKSELRPADLSNRKSHEANHNTREIGELTTAFRETRLAFVARLDELSEAQVGLEALHPRLKQPMRTMDLCYFVAEHDDQHLARMTEIARTLSSR